MKIKRNVNGQEMEFELTFHEMWQAYTEQEHLFRMEDVRNYVAECAEDADDVPELTEEQIDRAADFVTEWMDENDGVAETLWNIVDDAIKEVMKDGR